VNFGVRNFVSPCENEAAPQISRKMLSNIAPRFSYSCETKRKGRKGNIHKNAKLTPKGREEMVRRMQNRPAPAVAASSGVSVRTARRWQKRTGKAVLLH
jgi:hypothetical protein